ncbi:MAG TPA: TIGR04053 family radical SAM/SPASM domain-containing protein [Terriglobia bacterium]|nr:TIGR04053 family radical SAM/SPASM domain-containing protein [Terriglobia bacterium]
MDIMESPLTTLVPRARPDFNDRPFIVIWEVTQACDLACVHCRACAQPLRSQFELSTAEAKRLLDEIREMQAPIFVFTGGDPLKRHDIYDLVEYARGIGLRPSISPSATPLLTREAIAELKRRGMVRLAISLDGSTPALHDAFRGVAGTYARAIDAIRQARELGVTVQVNTTVTPRNFDDLDALAQLLETLDIALWSAFFLVPTGRAQSSDLVSAEQFEQVFGKLYEISCRSSFDVKTTEAMHFRRYVAQRRAAARRQTGTAPSPHLRATIPDGIGRGPLGISDAKGFVFVSHVGEVYPSGFLPLSAGNVRRQSLDEIYRRSHLFVSLRDTSNLKGKCGVCEFREICGGSRSRAYAVTGCPFASEPCCAYQPKAAAKMASSLA